MSNNIVIDLITNYFEELINQVDTDIEESIKKYKDQSLGKLKYFSVGGRYHIIKHRIYYESKIEYFDSNESSQCV